MDFETIGRRRLMMRLPAYRRQLETLKIPALKDLLKAYGFAAIQRDQVRAVEGHKTRHVNPTGLRLREDRDGCCSAAHECRRPGRKGIDPTRNFS